MKKIQDEKLSVLKEELIISEKFNYDELLPIMKDSLSRYVGEHVPEFAQDWTVVLNEIYPVVQNNLPSIFFRNPRAFLKPRQKTFIKKVTDPTTGKKVEVEGDSQKAAKTQEDIINYLLSEIKYKPEVRKVLTDALMFPYGILWHGYKGDFGMTDEHSLFIKKEQIFTQRVSPLRFLYDPCVSISELENARWVGRSVDIRYSELIEDKDLNIKDKNKIKGFKGFGNKGRSFADGLFPQNVTTTKKSMLDYAKDWFRNNSYSDFVRVYEIYLRPSKSEKNEGSKGKILLLCQDQDEPLRETEWIIKAEGWPSKILEFNPVPEQKFGLADVEVYSPIADQKNAIVNLQLRNAAQSSKVWVGINKDEADEEDIEKVRIGENTIVLFNGDKPVNQRMSVQSGNVGASGELYLIDQRIQKNLEDKSGVSDLKRGFLQSGEESATSVKIRAAGGSTRSLYRQDIMADFLKESIHYINQLNKQFVTIKDAVRIIGSYDIEWSETPDLDDIQLDTDVEIDVISMLPENPEMEAQRYMELLNVAIEGLSNPAVVNKLKEEGKLFNLAPLIEQILIRQRIKSPDIFRNIRPEESMGYVSVAEVRAAEANVNAIMAGQQLPSPPAPGQDHMARIEVYKGTAIVAAQSGNEKLAAVLQQLIQLQAQIFEEEMKKEPQVGRPISRGKK